MNNEQYLNLGREGNKRFSLPANWVIVNDPEQEEEGTAQSVEEMTRMSLAHPIGSRLLEDQVSTAGRIVILVDDGTRPTPVSYILAVVLGLLEGLGVPNEHITLVVALGSHAPLSAGGLKARLGADVVSRYCVVQHDAWQNDLVPTKIPGDDLAVKINPAVAAADLRIGISSILPHAFAGYGGGPKILMPGVCDAESLARHHMTRAVHPAACAGATKGNPFHESCMKIARTIGLEFSINCVYTTQGELAAIVSGSLEGAFESATELCRKKLGYRLKEKVDVTISSTYPHIHGIQFCKGFSAPGIITRENGAILLAAPITSPLPEDFVSSVTSLRGRYGGDTLSSVREIMSRGGLIVGDKSPEFNMALYDFLGRPPIRTLIVSPMIPPGTASLLGLEWAPSVEDGIRRLEEAYPKARVAVLPSGGLIIPMVDQFQ